MNPKKNPSIPAHDNERLFLLDAMALIYRAHFAFSKFPRVSTKGLNTGAIYGFTNTALQVLKKEKASHMGVAFDTSAPTFRHKIFEKYKEHREKQPEDIQLAIPWIKKILQALNLKTLSMDGYEADDLIGTLAQRFVGQLPIYMMTMDKDYAQLVQKGVFLYRLARMGEGVQTMDVSAVKERFGVSAEQIPDLLGLQGDSSDNIPGVPGIGPKTAVQLLQEHGSLNDILSAKKHLSSKKLQNLLTTYEKQALLSKQLAVLNTQAPIDCELNELKVEEANEKQLRALFEELEFNTLIKRLWGDEKKKTSQMSLDMTPTSVSVTPTDTVPVVNTLKKRPLSQRDYHILRTDKDIKACLPFLEKQTQVALHWEEKIGLAFSYQAHEAFLVPFNTSFAKTLQPLRPFLSHSGIEKIGIALKSLLIALHKEDIELKGSLFDISIADYLLHPEGRKDIDTWLSRYLGTHFSEDLTNEEKLMEQADMMLSMAAPMKAQLKREGAYKLYDELERPLIQVLADMQIQGVRVDVTELKSLSKQYAKEALLLEKEILKSAGVSFNILSPKQLGDVLFDKMRLLEKPKKTKSGHYATNEKVLTQLLGTHPVIEKIFAYREYKKLKNTYVDKLVESVSSDDGRIHADYRQNVAATGRLSAQNPNLQAIPIRTEKGRLIRKTFVPENKDYMLLSADYSQIELRILADFSKDPTLIKAFRETQDIHTLTASQLFGVEAATVSEKQRRVAKSVNFGIIYGISAFGLSQNLHIPRKEASRIINQYFEHFTTLKTYLNEAVEKAREKGYVQTILGRRRYLPDIASRNATLRNFAERNAINAPIQGSAADLIKMAMLRIHKYLGEQNLKTRMIMQVHDELVFEIHQKEKDSVPQKIADIMRTVPMISVPLVVSCGMGNHWLAAH